MNKPILQDGNKSITRIGQLVIPKGMKNSNLPVGFFEDNFQRNSLPNQKLFYLDPVAKYKFTMDGVEVKYSEDAFQKRFLAITHQLIRTVREKTKLEFIIDYMMYIDKWDCTIMATAFITGKE